MTGSQIQRLYPTTMSPAFLCSLQEREEMGVDSKHPLCLYFRNLPKMLVESRDQYMPTSIPLESQTKLFLAIPLTLPASFGASIYSCREERQLYVTY